MFHTGDKEMDGTLSSESPSCRGGKESKHQRPVMKSELGEAHSRLLSPVKAVGEAGVNEAGNCIRLGCMGVIHGLALLLRACGGRSTSPET